MEQKFMFTLGASFLAGIVSFLSPCILPLLPAYISFLAGDNPQAQCIGNPQAKSIGNPQAQAGTARRSALSGALLFGLGFALVFVLMGATATAIGRLMVQYQHIFSIVLGVVVLVFGLHMTGLLKIKILYNEKKFYINPRYTGRHRLFWAFVLGLAFAFGWTPCISPILGGILTLAAQQSSVQEGMMLLLCYAVGLWLPFIAVALFMQPLLAFISRRPMLAVRSQQVAGVLLIIMGIALMTGYMARLSYLLA
jgi:cytochrome c-type biogenesis protein